MKTVAVTGGSGYIASWIIKFLLELGYIVKASVRYPNDPKKTQHLLALDGAKERLTLIKVDMLDEGSFDVVVDGCDSVFHTASPFFLEMNNPEDTYEYAILILRAVLGSNRSKSESFMISVSRNATGANYIERDVEGASERHDDAAAPPRRRNARHDD